MKKLKYYLVLPMVLILAILIYPYFLNTELSTFKLAAKQGVLDISDLNINQTIIELSGTIASYPKELFSHEDFLAEPTKTEKAKVWAELPASWNTDTGVQYATERLLIRGLEVGKEYGFQIMDALTAFNVYVDGELIAHNGVVSADEKVARPEANPGIGLFKAQRSEVEIVFQVSNYESNITGLWQKICFGTEANIILSQQAAERIDAFVFGCCFIMALYHWILFIIMRKDRATLYFAAFCTLVAIKVAFSGQQLGFIWYSFLPYGIGIRLAYFVIPWIAVCCILFIHQCFKEEINGKFLRIALWLSVAQSLVLLFTKQSFYQKTFVGYQVFILVVCIMITYWIIKAIFQRKEGAGIYLVGFLALFTASINDILYSLRIIKTGYFLGFGLFVLILAQASIIAIRFLNAVVSEEKIRNNLEALVEERTTQLKEERNLFEHLSKVDSLTRIFNKRFLAEALEIEFESHERYGSVFSVIMADIDHFKNVNDQYGHLIGDEVLLGFASILQDSTRKTDIVGRFGGEEFLVIMRFTGLEEAKIHAENLRKCVDEAGIHTECGWIHITASFGVATIDEGRMTENELMKAVDEALYRAKENGRNRVEH